MAAVSGVATVGGYEPAAVVEQYDVVPIVGVPDGLRARVRRQLRTDETGREVEVRDRRRRTKLTRVYLFTDQPWLATVRRRRPAGRFENFLD